MVNHSLTQILMKTKEKSVSSLPMINAEETEKEWLTVKKAMVTQEIIHKQLQIILQVVKENLVTVQNLILNPLRNRLNVTTQEKLLGIEIESESLAEVLNCIREKAEECQFLNENIIKLMEKIISN